MFKLVALSANLVFVGQVVAQEAYLTHCAKCHPSENRLARKLDGATVQEKAAKLSSFLETHRKLDPEDRSKLVEYLMSLPPR